MAKHCDPACNKPVYKETVKVYERCAVVNCAYTEVIVTEKQDKDGVVTTELTDKEGNPLPADTKFFECSDPVNAIVCQPDVAPPGPITLEGEDCDGSPVEVTGEIGQLSHVIQAPGTVFKVQLCDNSKDFEKVVLCDKTNGHKVAVITDFTNPATPVVSYWDINNGEQWAGDVGDLESCADSDTESDPIEMCDGTTSFLRWIVLKNGEPTGVKFDTDIAGSPYTVSDESTVMVGKCETSCAKAPLGVVTSWAV